MKKFFLLAILGISLFLRTFRTSEYLGFWYDQGRDALIIADLLENKKWFLIGPTTGIEGIFLGPFYYYFIAPFYWLGNGDPVYPALWLGILSTAAIYLVYKIGSEYKSERAGFIAAILYGLSHAFASSARWLSNPTPLPFFALVILWCLLRIIHNKGRIWHWLLTGLFLGLSLHFEAASATFFLPVAFVVLLKNKKRFLLAFLAFGITLLPQFLFDLRHDHLLLKSFQKFLLTDQSFQTSFTANVSSRLTFYFEAFMGKIASTVTIRNLFAAIFVITLLVVLIKARSKVLTLLVAWWITPLIILLVYHGNNGYVWDYYFIGVYPAFILTMAYLWSSLPRSISALLVTIFLYQQVALHMHFFETTHPGYITLTTIKSVTDWVYTDAAGKPFNVDVYVPPVWSHAYDYVFHWRGKAIYHTLPATDRVSSLYLVVEPDGEHPYFRKNWLDRQDSYGKTDKEITVDPVLIKHLTRYNKPTK